MNDLVNTVADMTDARDKDSLELTMASVMFELIGAAKLDLWRLVHQNGVIRLRRRVRLDDSEAFSEETQVRQFGAYGRSARHPPRLGAPMTLYGDDDTPILETRPELYSCYTAKLYLRWLDNEGLCRHVFPVFDGREVICILEIQRATSLTEDQERLVHGLLRIYRNHFGMLDYSDCDDLTGLLNRRTFDETFRRVAARIAADAEGAKQSDAPERPPHLAVIDIDFFKRVNDRFGHPDGDEVLVLLARLMSNHFGEAQLLFRFGGEEFVVILTELTKEEAHETLEKFRRSVETFAFPQLERVTISIGSTAVKAGDTGSGAFGRAEQALYHSKRNGRNQTHSYEDLIAAGLLSTSREAENDVELFDALAPTKS